MPTHTIRTLEVSDAPLSAPLVEHQKYKFQKKRKHLQLWDCRKVPIHNMCPHFWWDGFCEQSKQNEQYYTLVHYNTLWKSTWFVGNPIHMFLQKFIPRKVEYYHSYRVAKLTSLPSPWRPLGTHLGNKASFCKMLLCIISSNPAGLRICSREVVTSAFSRACLQSSPELIVRLYLLWHNMEHGPTWLSHEHLYSRQFDVKSVIIIIHLSVLSRSLTQHNHQSSACNTFELFVFGGEFFVNFL